MKKKQTKQARPGVGSEEMHYFKQIGLPPLIIACVLYGMFLIRAMLTGEDYTLVCYGFITPVMLGECWYMFQLYQQFRRTWQFMCFVFMGIVGVIGFGIIIMALIGGTYG